MILRSRQGNPSLPNRVLPHLITLASLILGLSSMRFAIESNWPAAAGYLIIAGLLDGFDGYIARRMGVDSAFGAQLDSLVDFVSFGVAPAFLMYLWSVKAIGMLGWVICVGFTMCCGLRLARYHVTSIATDRPAWARGYFVGVPAPVGAMLVMVPMYFSFMSWGDESYKVFLTPTFSTIWVSVVAVLFISVIPTFSLRSIRLSKRMHVPTLAFVGGVCLMILASPWMTLVGLSILYLLSIPFSMMSWRRHCSMRASDFDKQ